MSLSQVLLIPGIGGARADTISGTAYPGETLTASGGSGPRDWQVDGVSTGQTGSTYTVTIYDIGKDIKCVTGGLDSNVLTCWHPSDVPEVKTCRVAWEGVLNSVGPDAEATVGQTVARWVDQKNGWGASHTTGAELPILRQANSRYYLEFDGVDDKLLRSGSELNVMRNVEYGFIILAARDRDPSGGTTSHTLSAWTTGGSSARFAVQSKPARSALIRRLDADSSTLATLTGTSDQHHVWTGHARWGDGQVDLRMDGEVVKTANHGSSGATADTASAGSPAIGVTRLGGVNELCPADIFCEIAGSGATDDISASNLSRLERFAMLCMGDNYTGPDIPLVSP